MDFTIIPGKRSGRQVSWLGFLAPRAFPDPKDQWHFLQGRLPHTVAGPPGNFTRFPILPVFHGAPVGLNMRLCIL